MAVAFIVFGILLGVAFVLVCIESYYKKPTQYHEDSGSYESGCYHHDCDDGGGDCDGDD